MATWNWYGYAQWTSNGRSRSAGSLTAPTQTTYAGSVQELAGTVADSTADQIFSSTGAGQDVVATWTAGLFSCDQDCRVLLRGSTDADTACWIVPANTPTPFPLSVIPAYNATLATHIAAATQAVTQIWIYQDSGDAANWQLVLTD